MKLGERRIIDDKEYAAVYHFKASCKRCAFQYVYAVFSGRKPGICKELFSETGCSANENGRLQQIVWIEVKK